MGLETLMPKSSRALRMCKALDDIYFGPNVEILYIDINTYLEPCLDLRPEA